MQLHKTLCAAAADGFESLLCGQNKMAMTCGICWLQELGGREAATQPDSGADITSRSALRPDAAFQTAVLQSVSHLSQVSISLAVCAEWHHTAVRDVFLHGHSWDSVAAGWATAQNSTTLSGNPERATPCSLSATLPRRGGPRFCKAAGHTILFRTEAVAVPSSAICTASALNVCPL